MKTLEEVYRLCEKTGAWYGVQINDFEQRNFLDDTVFHTVCGWGDINAVKILLSAGADVNARGDAGATPLFNAVNSRNLEVITFLLKSGADPRIPNDHKWLIADYAKNVKAASEIVQLLEKSVKEMNRKDGRRK